MDEEKMEELVEEMEGFHMPRYDELPRIQLYLEQVIDEVVYILKPIFGDNADGWITRTMVANYVKQGIVPRPTGKKYGREHIAYLVYISIAKKVLSMDEIKRLEQLQRSSYPIEKAYNCLCSEFENALRDIFNREPLCAPSYTTTDVEADVFRSTVISVGYAIYTRKMLTTLCGE